MSAITYISSMNSFDYAPGTFSKKELIQQLITDKAKITSSQHYDLLNFYPKLKRYGYFSRTFTIEEARKKDLFYFACNIGYDELIHDVIDVAFENKNADAFWLPQGISYDELRGLFSHEELAIKWICAQAGLNSERLFYDDVDDACYDTEKKDKVIHLITYHSVVAALQKLIAICPEKEKLLALTGNKGKTALHIAVQKGKTEHTKTLVDEIVRLKCCHLLVQQDKKGLTPLHFDGYEETYKKGLPEALTTMIAAVRQHIGPHGLQLKDHNGNNLLSSFYSRLPVIYAKALIDDFIAHNELYILEEKSRRGNPALFNHPNILLDFFIAQKNHKALAATDEKGNNFLHECHSQYSQTFIQYCVASGCLDLLWQTNSEGKTPLDGKLKQDELLALYLKHNPQALTSTAVNGRTPLHEACKNRNSAVIKTILTLYQQSNTLDRIYQKDDKGLNPIMELLHKSSSYENFNIESLLPFFKILFGTDDQLSVTWQIFNDIDKYYDFLQSLLFSESLFMQPWGKHDHTGSRFAKLFLREEKSSHIQMNSELAKQLEDAKSPEFEVMDTLTIAPSTSNRTIHKLNRTIIIDHKEPKRLCDAYKFVKNDESSTTLGLEATVTKIFAESKLMKSNLQIPIGCYSVKAIPTEIADKIGDSTVLSDGRYHIYHYRALKAAFFYLHDDRRDDKRFMIYMRTCIEDRVMQLKNGIHPVTADIWHNYRDQYRYVALADYMGVTRNDHDGMGRIAQGFNNIKYPNERYSGCVDLADFQLLRNKLGTKIKDILNAHCNKASSLQLNAICELYMTYALIAIYRRFKRNEIDWQNAIHYQQLANDLKAVFKKLFASYSQEEEEEEKVNAFADKSIDWQLMAQQISFFVVNEPGKGYYDWVLEGKLPQEIFPNMRLLAMQGSYYFSPKNKRDQFFREGLGFCEVVSSKIHDFGPFAGPLGWTVFELAIYLFTIFSYNIAEYKAEQQNINSGAT